MLHLPEFLLHILKISNVINNTWECLYVFVPTHPSPGAAVVAPGAAVVTAGAAVVVPEHI